MESFSQFYEKKNQKQGSFEKLYKSFLDFIKKELQLDNLPEIKLVDSKEDAKEKKSFGTYDGNNGLVVVNITARHPSDIFRTLAHELVHHKQNIEGKIKEGDGAAGTDIENEANALAGSIMRKFNHGNPLVFESKENRA